MTQLLYVGAGGFLGSVMRYVLTLSVQRIVPETQFPWGTLAVNALGCFAIGFLGMRMMAPDAPGRLFLVVGILGGFTTFSSFGFETYTLANDGEPWQALGNVTLQVVVGLAAVWIGALLARLG